MVGINLWRHDTQHNDTQHNDTHPNGTQPNDIQHNDTPHYNDTQHNGTQHNLMYCYFECHLCSVSIMFSVTNKLIMLSVIMLNVVCWVSWHPIYSEYIFKFLMSCIGYILKWYTLVIIRQQHLIFAKIENAFGCKIVFLL